MFESLAYAVIMMVVSYLLAPKVKTPNPEAATEMDAPTASAGSPVPVVFGTMTIKSSNYLGYWAKEVNEYDA